MTTWIQPYQQVITYNINHIRISVSSLELGVSAIITTSFYDERDELRRQEIALLDGQEYQDWTTDDYITAWVCKKYNLTPIYQ
jgi:hypothetical protein